MKTPSSETIHFLIFHIESEVQTKNVIARTLQEALREFVHLTALTQERDATLYSIFLIDSIDVKVLLKPQRFDAYKLSKAVEQLMPASERKPTDSVNSLEMVGKYLLQLKKRFPNSMFNTRVSFVSPYLITASTRFNLTLYNLNVSLEFVYIMLPEFETDDSSKQLLDFTATVRKWFNCSLIRVQCDKIAFDRLFKKWITTEMKHKVKLSFRPFAAVEIKCTAHRSIVNAMERMHINESCKCHGQPLLHNKNCNSYCLVSRSVLSTEDINTNITFEHSSTSLAQRHSESLGEITVLYKISQSEINLELLYGQPVVLSVPDPLSYILDDSQELGVHTDRFLALCEQLSQEDKALFVSSRSVQQQSAITQYFVLCPGKNTLLMQSIAVGDQLLPHYGSNDRKQQQQPSESAKSEITATLRRVTEQQTCDPFCYSTGMHDTLSQLIRAAPPKRSFTEMSAEAPAAHEQRQPTYPSSSMHSSKALPLTKQIRRIENTSSSSLTALKPKKAAAAVTLSIACNIINQVPKSSKTRQVKSTRNTLELV